MSATKMIKLEVPFGLDNHQITETLFIPKEQEITIKDFKGGDEIFY